MYDLDKAKKIERFANKLIKTRKPIVINDALMRGLGFDSTRDFFHSLGTWGYNYDFGSLSAASDTRVQSYLRAFIHDQYLN